MKILKIEWKHLDVKGETCNLCYDTGENLINEVKRLNRALNPKGIEIEIIETKLNESQINESNIILFDGVPIEDILEIKVVDKYCDSCTTLVGSDTYCRTVIYEDNEYEDIPAKAIRHAALKVLGIDEVTEPSKKSDCGCNCNDCC